MSAAFANMGGARFEELYVPIRREDLNRGDHIYVWRMDSLYSHHGIYVDEERVIHFVAGRDDSLKSTSLGSMPSSFKTSFPKSERVCPICRTQSNKSGVKSCCLDCFLDGGNLYQFQYGVTEQWFREKFRGMCTIVECDPIIDNVIHRAFQLLHKDEGFGGYHLFENNCEDFALYVKTGLLVFKNDKPVSRSTQAAAFQALKRASFFRYILGSRFARNIYANHRLKLDLSRQDVRRVPVETFFNEYRFTSRR